MAYEYIYDTRQVDVGKVAYDFEYELDNWPIDPHLYQELVSAIETWRRTHRSADKPFLYYSKAPGYITVYDGRNPHSPTRKRYEGLAALAIEICNEAAKSAGQIRTAVANRTECGDEVLVPVLNDLTARRVLYEERGKYFTLAIPENQYL
jgi:hypothetical protein